MLAIVGGLAAAFMWGIAILSSSRASRTVGATSTLAGVMLVGFAVAVPLAVATGVPRGLGTDDLAWLALAGTGNVVGLLLEYRGLRIGKVGVVAAIASTEGALAAVIAIAFGERVSAATTILLVVIASGVVLASIAADDPEADDPEKGGPGGSRSERERESVSPPEKGGPGGSRSERERESVSPPEKGGPGGSRSERERESVSPPEKGGPGGSRSGRRVAAAAAYGVGAAIAFGISLYATAHVGEIVPVPWVLVAARVVGVVALALPAAAMGRLRLTRPVVPLVVLSGLCELGGFAAFTIGSRHGIAVAAVLASQFAAIAAIGAYLLFRERLARVQLVGVATIVVGVAALAGFRA